MTLHLKYLIFSENKSNLEIAETWGTWETCHDAFGQVYVPLPWLDWPHWPDTTNGAKGPVKSAIVFWAP